MRPPRFLALATERYYSGGHKYVKGQWVWWSEEEEGVRAETLEYEALGRLSDAAVLDPNGRPTGRGARKRIPAGMARKVRVDRRVCGPEGV